MPSDPMYIHDKDAVDGLLSLKIACNGVARINDQNYNEKSGAVQSLLYLLPSSHPLGDRCTQFRNRILIDLLNSQKSCTWDIIYNNTGGSQVAIYFPSDTSVKFQVAK